MCCSSWSGAQYEVWFKVRALPPVDVDVPFDAKDVEPLQHIDDLLLDPEVGYQEAVYQVGAADKHRDCRLVVLLVIVLEHVDRPDESLLRPFPVVDNDVRVFCGELAELDPCAEGEQVLGMVRVARG